MRIKGSIYRKDGQWVFEIISPKWIMEDILFDVERKTSVPVKVVMAENPYGFGGQTYRSDFVSIETNKPLAIIADVEFDEAEKETSE